MPQSSWTAISDRIVARIKTVANVGRVHSRARLLRTADDITEHAALELGGVQVLRMWMLHLETPQRAFWADQGGHTQWDRMAVVEGFLQVEDENDSERTAIALGEQIIRVLNTDARTTRLGGTVLAAGPATFAPSPRPGEIRAFGFVVCHYIRLELPMFTTESP
jgi:hypothetical protein